MKRLHVIIEGRVQGVFFRKFTKDNAKRLGLTGWVRNNPDGTVEAVFDGKKEKLEKMLKLCHEGSQASIVEEVRSEWKEPTDEFDSFKIRY